MMFADDEEMGAPGDEMEEAAETMKMDDSSEEKPKKAKKEKQPGDWITVETPKISKAQAAAAKQEAAPPKPAAAPKPAAPSPMEMTQLDAAPSSSATAAPASTNAGPSAPAVQPASSGGSSVPLGGVLANMGVTDEKTQKMIVYIGGGLIALCCLCSCVAAAISFLPGMLGN